MFGHDHKDEDNTNENTVQPVNSGLLGIDDDDTSSTTSSQSSDAPSSEPAAAPVPDSSSFDTDTSVSTTPSSDDSVSASPVLDETTSTPDLSAPASENDDALLDIKREALEELSPLIDHLDQDAEEKFRTTMMMIQASDNKSLVPQAFTAAKAISDDAKRAQALLDIVNEINYFTQKHAE